MDKKSVGNLALKIGAQVMLIKNDRAKGLVNGSRGVLVEYQQAFDPETKSFAMFPLVRFDNGVSLTITTK